jgi:hypothetical protein
MSGVFPDSKVELSEAEQEALAFIKGPKKTTSLTNM